MIYKNPVIPGFYPDPSVCCADGRFYLVTSSFQYFPGVPLFESDDLVNWTQIGHVLTRESQLPLLNALSSAGIFAPTIRYYNGTFYMVTTNTTTAKNFYVFTNDIHGEWSEPIFVEQDGIDPSLYFENGHAYFMSNGSDDEGNHGVTQCEIDINTGKKLSPSKTIWTGSGGRYLESPHLYKIGEYYYLMCAEGGTEYGHMVTYARSKELWGKYEGYSNNPVLTNRNKGGYEIQGVGHGDLVQKPDTGEWFMLHLGFRQIGMWEPFHHLGRETFLTPVHFSNDGWFTCGNDGTVEPEYEISGSFTQKRISSCSFADKNEWIFLRNPVMDNYSLSDGSFTLRGCDNSISDFYPTFTGIRIKDFEFELKCHVSAESGEAGISIYMDEKHHYDIAVRNSGGKSQLLLRLNIGDAVYEKFTEDIGSPEADITINGSNFVFCFSAVSGSRNFDFGSLQTRYVSTEVACGFTGVVAGLYAQKENSEGTFSGFSLNYKNL